MNDKKSQAKRKVILLRLHHRLRLAIKKKEDNFGSEKHLLSDWNGLRTNKVTCHRGEIQQMTDSSFF